MTSLSPPDMASGSQLLRVDIYRQLRADILSCRLTPGAELREAELAARFAVSKSPVRDALMRLEREGLVIIVPRQGCRVAPISLSDVRDMFDFRIVLEHASIDRIIRHSTDAQLQALDLYRHFEPAAWPGGFIDYNRAFHRTLAGLSANSHIERQLRDLVDQMERVVTVSLANVKKGDSSRVLQEHCQLIDALQTRQRRRAEKIAERHIRAAGKRVYDALSRFFAVS